MVAWSLVISCHFAHCHPSSDSTNPSALTPISCLHSLIMRVLSSIINLSYVALGADLKPEERQGDYDKLD